ncbi:uncharacterized protein [Musca autumnalis]|uniref:uncharacterized protein n=1 Tax=Musca autumnalis TaxID=221902 RepID=UPI003CED0B7A
MASLQINSTDNVNDKLRQQIGGFQDWKTRPCDNFLHYACGNWPYHMEKEIPDVLHLIDVKLNEEFRQIFQQRNPRMPEMNFMRQARNYYESCLGMFGEKKPLNPVEYLKWLQYNEKLQWVEYSRDEKQHPSNFSWLQMLAIFRKYDLNNFIFLEEAMQHPWNNTKMIVAIKKPYAEGPYHYLGNLEDEQRKFTLRNTSDTENYEKYLQFDLELKEVWDYHSNSSERQQQMVTFGQLKHLQLQWLGEYLTVALQPLQLDPQMEIFIEDVDYLKTMKLFLDEVEDRGFLAKYLQLNFLSKLSCAPHGDHGYYDCTQSTRYRFPLVMQWLYKHHHPDISYEFYKLQLLFSNLKRNLKKHFMRVLEIPAQEAARNKLNNLKLQIIDVWQPAIEHLYSNLWLDPYDFVGNRLKLRHKEVQIAHSHLGDVVQSGALEFLQLQREDIAESLLPFSIPRQNLIVLPVTALQFPLYHPQLNQVFIYSSLGYLLAREVVKQFTNPNLQQIDANGNLNPKLKEYLHNVTTIGEDHQYEAAGFALDLAYETLSGIQVLSREEVKLFLLNFAHNHCSNYIKFGDHQQLVNTAFHKYSIRRWDVFGCHNGN